MKRTPWTGFDVLMLFAVWLAPLLASIAVVHVVSREQPQVEVTSENIQDHGHPVAQLIKQSNNSLVVFLVVFLAAIVIAPIVEEFLFRMLLQGWLETKFAQLQVPHASGVAVGIVALCFAAIHGGNHGTVDASSLIMGIVISSLFSLMVFVAGIIYLSCVREVRVTDYLFSTERFFRPGFFAGAGGCLLTIVFAYGLNVAASTLYPNTNVAPIPLFFFALALGVLYSRTQNLSYCILLHACLNGISLMLAWSTSGAV